MRHGTVALWFLLLLMSAGGEGLLEGLDDTPAEQHICKCNTAPVSCTQADTAEEKDCGTFCKETNKIAVLVPAKVGDSTGPIYCQIKTTTTTTTTTTTSPNTTTDGNETIIEKNDTIIIPDRCETGVLSGTKLLISKIFSYLSFAWILIWVLATIVTNFKHKNSGHHRWLHMFQEFFIVILWLFMGIFNLTFKTSATICKATSIVIHICVVVVAAALVFEAIFADAMVHNKSFINGKIPPFLNYILPIIIGLIPALVTYFIEKNSYITGLQNSGHHRWLHMFQEFFIVILWLFMGIFNLTFKTSATICKATSIVIHICVVVVAAALVFEAIFADSMVHNKSLMNGKIPPFLNYILPIIIGLIPALVTYFIEKNSYLTGLHCFAEVPLAMFWGFVVPVWILLYIACLKSSLGNIACDLTDEDVQDEDQIFWAKKSCKTLFFFSFNLLTCYLLCLFGSSQQRQFDTIVLQGFHLFRFIIFIFFFIFSLLFGPIIYITHTYCHRNSQRKSYGKGLFGGFYKPCPPKHVCKPLPTATPAPVAPLPSKKKKKDKNTQTDEAEPATKPENPAPPKNDPPAANRPSTTAPPRAATPAPPSAIPRRPSSAATPANWPNSREFYGWVGGKNKYNASQDALFMPKPS